MLHIANAVGIDNGIGYRHESGERRRQRHRTGAGAAAAMRGGKRLVQVDVHGIDADVARAHLADDGIEVGTVGIEIGAGRVHHFGNRHHVTLEKPTGVGIRQHNGGDVGRQTLLDLCGIDGAVGAGRYR